MQSELPHEAQRDEPRHGKSRRSNGNENDEAPDRVVKDLEREHSIKREAQECSRCIADDVCDLVVDPDVDEQSVKDEVQHDTAATTQGVEQQRPDAKGKGCKIHLRQCSADCVATEECGFTHNSKPSVSKTRTNGRRVYL